MKINKVLKSTTILVITMMIINFNVAIAQTTNSGSTSNTIEPNNNNSGVSVKEVTGTNNSSSNNSTSNNSNLSSGNSGFTSPDNSPQAIENRNATSTEKKREIQSFNTRDGKNFHLLVEEENQTKTATLLVQVSADELSSFVEDDSKLATKDKGETENPFEEESKKEETKLEKPKEKPQKDNSTLFIIGIFLIGFPILYYFKIYKKKQKQKEEEAEDNFDHDDHQKDLTNDDPYVDTDEDEYEEK